MFNSKLFTVIMVLTAVALLTLVCFQGMEMQQYDLFNTLKTRFFG